MSHAVAVPLIKRRTVRRRITAAAAVAVLIVLAACSDPVRPDTTAGATVPSPTTPQPAVSSPGPCADRGEHPFVVGMKDYRFVPSCLVVSGAAPFHLHNGGSREHNLTIPGTGFSVDVAPGKTVSEPRLMGSGVPPGTYRFFCRFHKGRGMTGTIHILAA
jgi:plastocyanin